MADERIHPFLGFEDSTPDDCQGNSLLGRRTSKTMRAVIQVERGLIQNVICDEPLEVLVIDRDPEANEGEIINFQGERAAMQTIEAEEDEMVVATLFDIADGGDDGFGTLTPSDDN
jgi:hypothetical protein